MKKTILSLIMVAVMLTGSFAQEKRYEIESAILKKSSVIMGQTISSTQYIADYGMKESAESVISMQGMVLSLFTMMKDGYAYSANLTMKQGTKTNIAKVVGDYQNINYLNLTDDVKKQYQIEEKGNEQFLGKDCKSYKLTVTVQGQTVNATILVWQGLALKATMDVLGTTVTEEVTEIQTGVNIPKEKFELPEGIEFVEVNLPSL